MNSLISHTIPRGRDLFELDASNQIAQLSTPAVTKCKEGTVSVLQTDSFPPALHSCPYHQLINKSRLPQLLRNKLDSLTRL